jgi:membrane protein DedA with SNARE-associated domain
VSIVSFDSLDAVFAKYGYAAVFFGVLLESTGLPLPGESLMIGAAIYAATTHHLNIFALVPIAAAGAICGDQIGYGIGHTIGYRIMARWGKKVGLSDERLELGRYLFRRYGGRVVFAGRFVAILRTFVALLAGANRMEWRSFLLWNTLGGIGWTSLYATAGYLLGKTAEHVSGPVGIALAVIGGGAVIACVVFIKRHESRLMDEARESMKNEKKAPGRPKRQPQPA